MNSSKELSSEGDIAPEENKKKEMQSEADDGADQPDDESRGKEGGGESLEDTVVSLKAQKVQFKSEFTNVRRGLLTQLVNGELELSSLSERLEGFSGARDRVNAVLTELCCIYGMQKNQKGRAQAVTEMESLEKEYTSAEERLLQFMMEAREREARSWADTSARRQYGGHTGLYPYAGMDYGGYGEFDYDDYEYGHNRPVPLGASRMESLAKFRRMSRFGDSAGSGTMEPDAAVGTSAEGQSQTARDMTAEDNSESALSKVSALDLSHSSAPVLSSSSGDAASLSTSSSTVVNSSLSHSPAHSSGQESLPVSSVQDSFDMGLPNQPVPLLPATSSTAPASVGVSVPSQPLPLSASAVPFSSMRPQSSGTQPARNVSFAPQPQLHGMHQPQPTVPQSAMHASTAVPVTWSATVPRSSRASSNSGQRWAAEPWTQLQRVGIPVFSGDRRTFESFMAAFQACVDSAPATPEYKLLQLRQYLAGEALTAVEQFGFTPSAYQAAKDLLMRKYGGERRRVAMHLEQLEQLPVVRFNRAKDMEKFAELLSVAVVNLKDSGRSLELGAGTFYATLLRKLDERNLAQYHRWRHEKRAVESVVLLLEWLTLEAEFLVVAAETVEGLGGSKMSVSESKAPVKKSNSGQVPFRPAGRTYVGQASSRSQCPVCHGLHPTWKCTQFKMFSMGKRWQVAKQHGLCYRCLDTGHAGRDCTRTQKCGIDQCQETHHRLLHSSGTAQGNSASTATSGHQSSVQPKAASGETKASASSGNGSKEQADAVTNCASHVRESGSVTEGERSSTSKDRPSRQVPLRTVPVTLFNGSKRLVVNALLDDGSTKSYLNADVAAELGLSGSPQRMVVDTLNGHREEFCTTSVTVGLQSLDGRESTEVELCTTQQVVSQMEVVNWQDHASKWEHLKGIVFPSVSSSRHSGVDVLLGVDYADLHVSLRDIRGRPGEPVARLTPLGWTCVAPCTGNPKTGMAVTLHAVSPDVEPLDRLLRNFWEVESVPEQSEPALSRIEQAVVKSTKKSISRVNDRYRVGIPWCHENHDLPDNLQMAMQRLQCTEKRLAKQPEVARAYHDVINKYQAKGYIREVPADEMKPESRWLLPHFPVVRLDKTTTKVRMVFDASAQYLGTSLNNVIHQGPKLQADLTNVLLRFRRKPVALGCDISEMYLQIELEPDDRPFHRFLWRTNPASEVKEFEFSRVVFGVNCSPFLAQLITRCHAEDAKTKFPEAAETVLKSTYMDDSLDSANTVEGAIRLYEKLSALWADAGMHARKWLSNSEEVLEVIPAADRMPQLEVISPEQPVVKTLGVRYGASEDTFTFELAPLPVDFLLTKRTVLKKVASIFDPLGFLTPFTVRAKMLIQGMWAAGLQWDEPLNQQLETATRQWFTELPEVSAIEVPRCLQFGYRTGKVAANMQCHVFADASEQAYGAVAYLRVESECHEVMTRLISAKSRVTPLSTVTIPRLELMAAVMAVRLASSLVKALDLPASEVVYWTDSLNVLYWIRGSSRRYKTFVANRVSEIQESSEPSQWHHVPTDQNPADLISRGSSVTVLNADFWWRGPSFLVQEQTEWPQMGKLAATQPEATAEVKKEKAGISLTSVTHPAVATELSNESRLHPDKFVTWKRGVRLWARVLRFAGNCRKKKEHRQGGELTADELAAAETQIIKIAQSEVFRSEMVTIRRKQALPDRNQLSSLSPFIDDEGILRCGGRLEYADFLPRDSVQPIIMPRHHSLTKLLVQHYHEEARHVGGTNQVYAHLCSRYWIIAGREVVRDVERKCPRCKLLKARPAKQIMAPLPRSRITPSFRAFARTGVDFAGPFLTIQGRGRKRTKRYLCLFTCLATRAVHLELAYSLDTDSFLNAFYRFVGRRGLPELVISDNGTNFVGAQRELKELVTEMDQSQIVRTVADQKVVWQFNPPAAPHFGGVFEVMVRAAKRAVHAILQSADITDEELATAFVAAESLINSRPLTYVSSSPSDETPLTPNHFLFGQCGGTFAPSGVDTTEFNPRKRWRRVQQLAHHFWQRWIREWLPLLSARKKWRQPYNEVKPGDVMLMLSPSTPRGSWPLVKVLEVFPGRDGHVRVAKVKVGNTTLVRPISKLCPVESPADQ